MTVTFKTKQTKDEKTKGGLSIKKGDEVVNLSEADDFIKSKTPPTIIHHSPTPDDHIKATSEDVVGMAQSMSVEKDDPKVIEVPTSSYTDAEIDIIKNMMPVSLSSASYLYQPVKSTSSGSMYHVIGITENDDLKIACRFKEESISIRAEGDLNTYHEALENSGIGVHNKSQGYVSRHFSITHVNGIPDHIIFRRTIGALLAGLGVTLKTPIPNTDLIFDQGV